jgi:hypothetical protein
MRSCLLCILFVSAYLDQGRVNWRLDIMPNKIAIFRDDFRIIGPTEEQNTEWNDSFGASGRRSMRVRMKASHSGIINKNLRFYIPSKMESGSSTFIKKKPTPILKHHKKDEDPVGKVVEARYVHTIPETLKDDPLVKILTDAEAPVRKQVRAAKKFIKNDFVKDENWEGLGYVELVADIYDEKTIRDIQDGLIHSVSVGFNSNHAFCSECSSDWASDEDGLCEHRPGKKCFDEDGTESIPVLIPGDMFFKENSFVNFDADPHTVIEVFSIGDSERKTEYSVDFDKDMVYDTDMTWEIKDHENEEAANMGESINPASAPVLEPTKYFDKVCEVIKANFADLEEEVLKEAAKKVDELFDSEGNLPFQKDAELGIDTAILYTHEWLNSGEEVNADEIYDEMQKELDLMVKDGLISEEEATDAKLSPEQREKLKTSTFCGPGRSFPVPDCAHVTAARRLVGRYKGPGNKSSILACVSRKAKALGCSSSKDAEQEVKTNTEDKKCACDTSKFGDLSDKELRTIFYAVNMELVDRDLSVGFDCKDCATNLKRAIEAEDELRVIKGKVEDQDQTLVLLRDELRTEFMNFKSLSDEYVDIALDLRNLKIKHASVISVIAGEKDSIEIAQKHFSELEDFEKQYDNFVQDEKVAKIVNELNDGTTGEPESIVTNPVGNQDRDNVQEDEVLSKTEIYILDNCKEHIKNKETSEAHRLFVRMKNMGVLRDSLTWEKAILAADDADKS